MELMLTTKAAVFFELESLRSASLIFRRRVVAAPAFDTRQSSQIPHGYSLRYLQAHPHQEAITHQRDHKARRKLRQYFTNDARPYRPAALTDRKAQLFLQSNRRD